MTKLAVSDSIAKVILEKWGVKLADRLSLTICMNPDSMVTANISKILTQDEADDLAEVLGEYYLVKRS